MRIDAINNFLADPNADKIRLHGRYHSLPTYSHSSSSSSLDHELRNHDDDDVFHHPYDMQRALELAHVVSNMGEVSSERQQTIIRSYYFEGKTIAEIAKDLGLGVNYTQQLHRCALWEMNKTITSEEEE
jgi:DNA-directed RNA polymerase specialized sigma subunit